MRKKIIQILIGILIATFTVFAFLSCISYLIHWKTDMSSASQWTVFDSSFSVENAAGLLGHRFATVMVGQALGVGSFVLFAILALISLRLIFGKFKTGFLKIMVAILGASVLTSVSASYLGRIQGNENLLAGGWGGRCGSYAVSVCENLMGPAITGLAIMLLVASFLFLCFSYIFPIKIRLGEASGQDVKKLIEEEMAAQSKESDIPESPEATETPEITESPLTEDLPAPVMEEEPIESDIPLEPVTEIPAVETVQTEGSLEIVKTDNLETEDIRNLPPIDNRLDPPDGLPKYKSPPLSLLEAHSSSKHIVSDEEIKRNNNKIRAVLGNYKIQLSDVQAIVGPTVTLYKTYPAPGVKISAIKQLQEDIAISLGAKGVRVVTLSDSVGIEVANDIASMVPLKALLNDNSFRESKACLPIAIGYTITQKVKVFDLADAPHLLVAGATKQGKSVGLNVIVGSLLYSCHPSELKFVFIDPKMVEFSAYNKLLNHYLAALPDDSEKEELANVIVKTPKRAEKILRSLCIEMDERYTKLSEAGVNNIKLYNEKYKERKLRPDHGHKFLPYLVVVVDEYADLTMTTGASPEAKAASRSITNSIIRLAQKGRAAGIHVILATQRPSVDVISGLIKSNFPMRIAFRTASRTDSQTILDAPGAEKLIGNGDMLFSAGIDTERIQCGFVSGKEIDSITEFIGEQKGYGKSYNAPYYLPEAADAVGDTASGNVDMTDVDERFAEAARVVVTNQKGSTSDLQRKLGMGYAKAGRVMDQLEAAGIVGPQDGTKTRAVLVSDLEALEEILARYGK